MEAWQSLWNQWDRLVPSNWSIQVRNQPIEVMVIQDQEVISAQYNDRESEFLKLLILMLESVLATEVQSRVEVRGPAQLYMAANNRQEPNQTAYLLQLIIPSLPIVPVTHTYISVSLCSHTVPFSLRVSYDLCSFCIFSSSQFACPCVVIVS